MKPESKDVRIMHGNEACAEGALIAGCKFFAGYPITPATEVAEVMAKRIPKENGVFIQMEDELASINAVIGAAWGGAKSMTATSGPGFSLMQEGIGYAVTTETPCVVVDVMRGGPSTGQPTMSAQQDVYQAKYGSHGDYELIVLVPSSAQEALDMTIRAFNLSEKYLVPVLVLTDEIVGHTRERVVFPTNPEIINRRKPTNGQKYIPFDATKETNYVPDRADFGEGYNILVDGQLHDAFGNRVGHIPADSAALVERLCKKILENVDDILEIEEREIDDADVVIVAYGSSSRPALRAMREARDQGLKVGLVKIKTLFPFPEKRLKEIAAKVNTFVVPEMNLGKIVNEVERVTKKNTISIPKIGGELHTPNEILNVIKEVVR
jgi:2-oxoglutarate ferredoxin oxidoreductase subunit alpha